jgi:hypothetical protein
MSVKATAYAIGNIPVTARHPGRTVNTESLDKALDRADANDWIVVATHW